FPQMTMSPEAKATAGEELWTPNFVDYLFIAFNTNTAFSPTDVPVLARWAKVLMMLQSLLSLLIMALVAARRGSQYAVMPGSCQRVPQRGFALSENHSANPTYKPQPSSPPGHFENL